MGQKIKVWDIATRLFHWSLVLCFFTAYITGEGESLLHIYISYVIIGLLAFRLVWGLIGPKYVRFTNFVRGIKPGLVYLQSLLRRHPQYYLGHNPLGGWMIVLLLVFLAMTSWTGLELYAQEGKGPLAAKQAPLIQAAQADDRDHEDVEEARLARENEQGHKEWLEELHEALASFTLLLVFVHIGGVFVSGWLHKENLAKAMWTGYKTPPEDFKED
jgi:cytochrome b